MASRQVELEHGDDASRVAELRPDDQDAVHVADRIDRRGTEKVLPLMDGTEQPPDAHPQGMGSDLLREDGHADVGVRVHDFSRVPAQRDGLRDAAVDATVTEGSGVGARVRPRVGHGPGVLDSGVHASIRRLGLRHSGRLGHGRRHGRRVGGWRLRSGRRRRQFLHNIDGNRGDGRQVDRRLVRRRKPPEDAEQRDQRGHRRVDQQRHQHQPAHSPARRVGLAAPVSLGSHVLDHSPDRGGRRTPSLQPKGRPAYLARAL
jgi:hypothetical protein